MRRSHSNVLRNGLTPGQERAISAMLTAPSIAAAARQADVGQSTLRRWLREDDNFQNELRQYREEALSHAALMLQQGAARAVCLMYELIESDSPVDSGKVTLIRTAIEFAFRSAVFCDIIDRVRALEKTHNPPSAPIQSEPLDRAATSDRESTPDSKQSTSQDLRRRKPESERIFRQSAHSCSNRSITGHPIAAKSPRQDKEYGLFQPFSLLGMRPARHDRHDQVRQDLSEPRAGPGNGSNVPDHPRRASK